MQQIDKNKFKYYNKCNKHNKNTYIYIYIYVFFPLSFKKYNKLDEHIYTLFSLSQLYP